MKKYFLYATLFCRCQKYQFQSALATCGLVNMEHLFHSSRWYSCFEALYFTVYQVELFATWYRDNENDIYGGSSREQQDSQWRF